MHGSRRFDFKEWIKEIIYSNLRKETDDRKISELNPLDLEAVAQGKCW